MRYVIKTEELTDLADEISSISANGWTAEEIYERVLSPLPESKAEFLDRAEYLSKQLPKHFYFIEFVGTRGMRGYIPSIGMGIQMSCAVDVSLANKILSATSMNVESIIIEDEEMDRLKEAYRALRR